MTTLQQIAAWLRWYEAIGVDDPVGDDPVDLTALPRRESHPSAMPPIKTAAESLPDTVGRTSSALKNISTIPATTVKGSEQATVDARAIAGAARTLVELEAALGAFDGCPLKVTATNTVFSDGHPDAEVMVIGEAPGSEEDRLGKPFVGPAGQLLDQMLNAIGLTRAESVYITNILPWRPPGNRQPNQAEVAVCLPFIERHVVLKAPKLLILAGGTSAKTLLAATNGIMRLRGRWADYAAPGFSVPVPAMPIFHPAFLLRQPAMKRDAWRDLLQIKKKLGDPTN